MKLTRSEFLRGTAATALAVALRGTTVLAQGAPLITRKVGKTGEVLPIVGLGTAQTFGDHIDGPEFASRKAVIQALLDNGGTVIDSSPTYSKAEIVVGRALKELGTRNKAYISGKISISGEQAGIDQFNKSMQEYGIDRMELLHIHNIRDFNVHLKTVRRLKDEGKVKAIGVTHFQDRSHDELIKVIKASNLDWVQFNYALDGREAEDDLLPLAKDLGMGVMINLPFGRNRLFQKVAGKPLPEWAKEFDADSWGQFFLKYILANDAALSTTWGPRAADFRMPLCASA
jgi:aryl-alcohol dehydrogenase-like predicted oxidoreductase